MQNNFKKELLSRKITEWMNFLVENKKKVIGLSVLFLDIIFFFLLLDSGKILASASSISFLVLASVPSLVFILGYLYIWHSLNKGDFARVKTIIFLLIIWRILISLLSL